MVNTRVVLVGLACCGFGATTGLSQVEEWEFIKGVGYSQTVNDTAPASPDVWYVDSAVFAGPADINAANIDSVYDFDFEGDGEWDMLELFGSAAAWDAAFPDNTTFTLNITAGALAPLSQAITLSVEHTIPTGVPYLTGTSYDDLQGLDASSGVTLGWDSAASGGAAFTGLSVFLNEDEVFSLVFGPDDTGTVIPADTFLPGETYELELVYANATFPPADPAGFDADGLIVGERLTTVFFTTAGDCACEFGGDASMIAIDDLLAFLALWFPANGSPPAGGAGTGADLTGDNVVDVADLLAFLACWFPASATGVCTP